MKKYISKIIIICLILLPIIIYLSNPKTLFDSKTSEYEEIQYSPAKVINILPEQKRLYPQSEYPKIQKIEVKLLSKKYKNKIIMAENYIWDLEEYNFDLKPNQKVLIKFSIDNNDIVFLKIEDYYRKNRIYGILIILTIFLIIFTKKIGLKLLLTLFITFFTLFFITIPYFIASYSIIIITLFSGFYIIITSFLLIMGFSLKTLNSIITTLISLIIVTTTGIYIIIKLNITGFTIFEVIRIVSLTNINPDNIFLLWIAGIFFSMIGAIMDVAGGISSALHEITENQNGLKDFKKIFISGCNVGRDVISTELSTIFFAYTGLIIVQFLTYSIMNTPFLLYINWEFINIFLLFPILSSMGIIITIPLAIIIWIILQKINFYKTNFSLRP